MDLLCLLCAGLDRKPGDIDGSQAPSLQTGLKNSSHYDGAEKGINDGWNLQHIYEGGGQFEKLLDHPSWYGRVAKYLGHASPFVFELFINVRNQVSRLHVIYMPVLFQR